MTLLEQINAAAAKVIRENNLLAEFIEFSERTSSEYMILDFIIWYTETYEESEDTSDALDVYIHQKGGSYNGKGH